MNSNSSQNPLPGSSSSSNNGPPNGPNHASSSGPSVTATSQQNGSLEAPLAKPPVSVQIAKTGGIGLSTTLSSQQAAALQQRIEHAQQQKQMLEQQQQQQQQHQQQVAQVLALSTAFRIAGTGAASYPQVSVAAVPTAAPQPQQAVQAPQKPSEPVAAGASPAWSVPNPLLATGQPQRQMEVSKPPPQQQLQQPQSMNTNIAPAPSIAMNRQPIQQPQIQQVPLSAQSVRPVLHPQPAVPMPIQQQQQQPPPQQQQPMKPKPKVILSPEAKQCLARAIWSAIRSPDGLIAKDLMEAAMATGLPKHAILNAARVAREREALKRKGLQPPPMQQQQQQQQPPVKQAMPPQQTTVTPPPPPQSRPSKPKSSKPPTSPAAAAAAVSKPAVPPKPKISSQQALAQKMAQAKLEERQKWNRVQNGVFMTQKGRFAALPHSLSGIQRTKQEPTPSSARKRPHPDILRQARLLQQRLQQQPSQQSTTITLLDPEKFKRAKIEPKKHAKALDRIVRKGRQTASEALNKQHKELSKQISSHQQEFFKFHRSRRQEAYKIAKAIRDNLDKDHKKKEKDVVTAEKARLAALKANDMDAYSKLLEETKNDRLKFLMDKTERHFSQISTSLLETRNKDGSVASSGGTSSYYASAHLKQEEVRQPSILTGGDLKEYQMSGLQWLISLYNNKLNGILADEMGLGKTIQAISLIAYLMEYKNNLGPYLVVVPLSTLSNWVNEFTKWCPSAHMICYKGTPAQRKELYKDQVRTGHFNVLLTTYEYIIKDKANLRKISWEYAIVDEGHRMKNSASKFAKTLSSQYITKYRLLLTGTPLMNDLSELWALLNFLLPAIFNSVETFDSWFNRPFAQFGNTASTAEDEANFLSNEERMFIIHRLHELLRPFMLRRVKSEVLDQLPEKVEKVLRCELSSWQKELYKQISKKVVEENGLSATGVAPPQPASRGLNNVVMQLRKVCNHPYLFSPEGYHINEKIIRSSGKLELLDRMLPKLRAGGHRILMFTQMTAVMTILEDYFAYRGYMSLRLDGSTPADEREKRMYKFNSPDSPYFIFLLSTRAGGLGLNLTAADTVIIFDSDWNPMMDLQAQDRAHRIGQRSEVSVFRLITYSPVEEKILSRATEKLNMSELVVEAGKFDKSSVEKDNSLERKKMMEVLLTDFDTTTNKETKSEVQSEIKSEITSEVGEDEDNDDDNASDGTDKEDLNDLLSNNENDYQLYDTIDEQRASDPTAVDASLYTDPEDVPDWIKYPSGKKDAALEDTAPGSGARKRKDVMYDDGLTEKQFMRMMDKQADGELAAKEDAKATRRAATPSSVAESAAPPENVGSELTDWTFRKLTSCTKSVIALKDPATKRRICDIFMEKPSPEQYPDYYDIIEKPIAINDILRKCRAKMYSDLQEFRNDWKLMFTNASTFNGVGSWIDEDGKSLEKELERILKKNGFNEETPKQQKPPPPKKKKFRIKLSLKSLKAKEQEAAKAPEPEPEPEEPEEEVKPTRRGRKPKKRKLD